MSLTAIGLGLASHTATRLLVDLKREKRIKQEIAEFDKELKDAVLKKDKQREEKLRKRKPQMDKMRLKASSGRFKVFMVTWVPFIVLYYLMAELVGGYYAPVAFSPLPIPYIVSDDGSLALLWWYFISSLSFNTMFGKVLGTVP
ncbi:MAG: DUF106 domain-containing protein [Thaumarchaeota archaeon]|nr:DUF106 domain-containing protein [Nitrososphaerota archaeon]